MTEEELEQVKQIVNDAIKSERHQKRLEYAFIQCESMGRVEDADFDSFTDHVQEKVDEGWQINHIIPGNKYSCVLVMSRPTYHNLVK